MKILIIVLLCVVTGCNPLKEKQVNTSTSNKQSVQKLNPGEKLTLHDPFREEDNEKWRKEIKYVASTKDFERMEAIFHFRSKTDAIYSAQYALDLFEIYKLDPIFYIESVYKSYPDNPEIIIREWVNEVGDVTIEEIENVVKEKESNSLVKKFMRDIDKYNSTFQNMINN